MNPSDTGKLVAVYARVSTEHEAQLQALDIKWSGIVKMPIIGLIVVGNSLLVLLKTIDER